MLLQDWIKAVEEYFKLKGSLKGDRLALSDEVSLIIEQCKSSKAQAANKEKKDSKRSKEESESDYEDDVSEEEEKSANENEIVFSKFIDLLQQQMKQHFTYE